MANETTPGNDAQENEEVLTGDDQVEGDEAEDQDEGDESEDSDEEGDGEKAEGEDGEKAEDKKPSKWAVKRAKQRERIASLEQSLASERRQRQLVEESLRTISSDFGKEPKREDYQDEAQYIGAYAAYESRKSLIQSQRAAAEAQHKSAGDREFESRRQLFIERTMALSDRMPDIRDRVFSEATFPVPLALRDVFMDDEDGPLVAYHLSSHPAEMQRVFQMTPLAAAREVGRIAARLSAPKPKTQTQAPKPATVVRAGTPRVVKKDDDKTVEEWRRDREAHLARLRKKAS